MIFKKIKMEYKGSCLHYEDIEEDDFIDELDSFFTWLGEGGVNGDQAVKFMNKVKVKYKAKGSLADFLYNYVDHPEEDVKEELPIVNFCSN